MLPITTKKKVVRKGYIYEKSELKVQRIFGSIGKQNTAHPDGIYCEIVHAKHTGAKSKFQKQNVGYLGKHIQFTVINSVN